jgi:hypothetical protein
MTRTILTMATIAACLMSGAAGAQIIGTYRPSVVTYFPAATSAAPATYQMRTTPITPVSYYPTTTVSAPITTLGAPQVVSPYPVASASYYGNTVPVASTSYHSAPLGGNACCCPTGGVPVAPLATTSYSPAPIVYANSGGMGGNRYIGRTLWGSPKVYASGQPVRNALRWLGP